MDNKCRKFEANIFNKAKCQNCFKSKDDHSAQALENSRVRCSVLPVFFLDLPTVECTMKLGWFVLWFPKNSVSVIMTVLQYMLGKWFILDTTSECD